MTELQTLRWGPASGGTPRQLVILCHGVGTDGHDLIDLAPLWGRDLPDAAFAAPDAPQRFDGAPFGRQWWPIGDRDPARMASGAALAQPLLDAFIDAELARLGLPGTAYALMGFSQGAMMVLYAGLRRATAPVAILAYSGALIAPDQVGERANSAPVLLVHGEADEVVPPSRSRQAQAVLQAAGLPVRALYRPGLGHGIDPVGLSAGAEALVTGFGL